MGRRKKPSKNAKRKAEQKARAEQRRRADAEVAANVLSGETPASADSPKFPTFAAEAKKEWAAQLLAEDHLTDTAIAQTVGIDRKTLWNWQQEPEFAALVDRIRADILNLTRRYLIARKSYRVGNLQRRLLALEQVIAERGEQPHMQGVAGGKTGLLVRKQRMLGTGENAMLVDEHEVDTALLKEMREHEKQAAVECGQWTEKKEVTGTGGGPLLLQIIEDVADDSGEVPPQQADAGETPSSTETLPQE